MSESILASFFHPGALAKSVMTAMRQISAERSATLGDRTTYVGSSDIGGCLRKAFLEKVAPLPADEKKVMACLSGHLAEVVFEAVLGRTAANGAVHLTQVHAQHPKHRWARCHIDNVLHDGQSIETARHLLVVETKFNAKIPYPLPYDNQRSQLQYQIGLLASQYPPSENRQIAGVLLASDFRDILTDFELIMRPSKALFSALLRRGETLRTCLRNQSTPAPEPTITGCSFCERRLGCPAHTDGGEPIAAEVAAVVEEYVAMREHKKRLSASMARRREMLCRHLGENFKGTTDKRSLHCYREQATTFDEETLRRNYPEIAEECSQSVIDWDLLARRYPGTYSEVVRSAPAGPLRLDIR